MTPKNKCECGRYKNEFDGFCIYCESNPETKGYSTCSMCNTRKNDNLIFTEPDCPKVYCKDCVKKIKSTANFVCKFCGIVDKETNFANHYTCFECYKKRREARMKRYKETKKQREEMCKRFTE